MLVTTLWGLLRLAKYPLPLRLIVIILIMVWRLKWLLCFQLKIYSTITIRGQMCLFLRKMVLSGSIQGRLGVIFQTLPNMSSKKAFWGVNLGENHKKFLFRGCFPEEEKSGLHVCMFWKPMVMHVYNTSIWVPPSPPDPNLFEGRRENSVNECCNKPRNKYSSDLMFKCKTMGQVSFFWSVKFGCVKSWPDEQCCMYGNILIRLRGQASE